MLWMSREKLYHLNRETRIKGKREAFVEVFEKVKLVLVNIRSKLDISMPIMVTNPSIGFRVWHHVSLFFWRCNVAFFIWCCRVAWTCVIFYMSGGDSKTWHVAWFYLLIFRRWYISNWKLIWSQIFDHD